MFKHHCCYSEHNSCGFFKALVCIGHFLASFLLLAIRVFFGVLLIYAGLGKFAEARTVAEYFASINIPLPSISVYVVAIIEVLAGAALVVGFATRFAALLLIIIMVGAFATAHIAIFSGFWADPSVILTEKAFSFLLGALVILCFGPGVISLDYLIERFICKNKCCNHEHPHN